MATLLKGNSVFLHVPKTGGTFLRRLFVALDLVVFDFASDHSDMEHTLHVKAHYPGNYYKRSLQLGGDLEKRILNSYKFCFVRNPYDWYTSYWRFMADHNWRSFDLKRKRSRFGFRSDPWYPLAKLEKLLDPDFNAFMFNVTENAPGFLSALYAGYTADGKIDFTGRQETLPDDLKKIFSATGTPADLSKVNLFEKINAGRTDRPQWNGRNRDAVFESEKDVFERYDYCRSS